MMQEFFFEVKKTVGQVMLFITFWGLGALLEGRPAVAAGLFAGALTGIIYFILMSYRLKKASGLSISKAVFSMRMGWLIRFAFVLLMLIISLRVSYIDFWAAVVGLFSLHIIIFLNAVVKLSKGFTNRK
jgi:hypothetical protein